MRKGDEKRQQLLDTAEKLFCQRGYEASSVQDILNAASMSKGGFYHHFSGKEEVLAALCARRAQRAAAFAAEALNRAETPMARINAVLYAFMPLRREEAGFAAMLLPVITTPEGRALAMIYQDALLEQFLPLLRAEVAAAVSVEAVCPPVRDMERVVLHIVNHCWLDTAAMLTAAEDGQRHDRLALLQMLDKYRRAVEVLLDAPYGAIEIIRVEEMTEFGMRNL